MRVVSQREEKITEDVDTKKEVLAAMNRARVRAWHNGPLRRFVNQREINTNTQLIARVAEWKAEMCYEVREFPKQGQRKSALVAGGRNPWQEYRGVLSVWEGGTLYQGL